MTPVTQSKLVGRDGYGTCWTAALASMLDLPEHAVPHFANPDRFSDGSGSDLEATVNADAILMFTGSLVLLTVTRDTRSTPSATWKTMYRSPDAMAHVVSSVPPTAP